MGKSFCVKLYFLVNQNISYFYATIAFSFGCLYFSNFYNVLPMNFETTYFRRSKAMSHVLNRLCACLNGVRYKISFFDVAQMRSISTLKIKILLLGSVRLLQMLSNLQIPSTVPIRSGFEALYKI